MRALELLRRERSSNVTASWHDGWAARSIVGAVRELARASLPRRPCPGVHARASRLGRCPSSGRVHVAHVPTAGPRPRRRLVVATGRTTLRTTLRTPGRTLDAAVFPTSWHGERVRCDASARPLVKTVHGAMPHEATPALEATCTRMSRWCWRRGSVSSTPQHSQRRLGGRSG